MEIRVFIINGKVVGSFSRIPKKGSFLSNLSKGGTVGASKLTIKDFKFNCKKIKKRWNLFCWNRLYIRKTKWRYKCYFSSRIEKLF